MSENTFDSEEINLQIQPLPAFIDNDGSFKLNTPLLSSMNFDGLIPRYDGLIYASQVKAGYLIDVSLTDEFSQVISIEYDDPDLEVTNLVTINYINNQGFISSQVYNDTDLVYVNYDDWDNKIIGTQGWGITNSGNAIFSNVAVRGRVEATEGSIEGDLILGGSLTASTNNGQLILSSSGIFGSTSTGLFHLDSIDGEITFTGNINANSGTLKYLTIGNNFYPVLSIVGQASSSVQDPDTGLYIDSRNLIMTVFQTVISEGDTIINPAAGFKYPIIYSGLNGNTFKRYMAAGDYFILSNVSASGYITDNTSTPIVITDPLQMNYIVNGIYEVISASIGLQTSMVSGSATLYDAYYCRKYQSFTLNPRLYDFSSMSASSASFTSGFSFIGEYTSINGPEITRIDGLVLESVRPGTTWYDYIPDFLDLSGRFRLGYGSIIKNTSRLIAQGDLKNKQEVYSVSSSFFAVPYYIPGLLPAPIDEKYSNYIFEINPPGSSCVIQISSLNFEDGDYFDFINIKNGASVTFNVIGNFSFTPSLDSYQNKTVLSGQWSSARIRKRSASSWFLSGDLS